VTRRAVLGFHAARSIDRRGRLYAEPEASELVFAWPIRRRVQGLDSPRGGLTSRLLLLRGRELTALISNVPGRVGKSRTAGWAKAP